MIPSTLPDYTIDELLYILEEDLSILRKIQDSGSLQNLHNALNTYIHEEKQ